MAVLFSFKDTLQMAAEISRLTDTSHLTWIEASMSCSKHNQVDVVLVFTMDVNVCPFILILTRILLHECHLLSTDEEIVLRRVSARIEDDSSGNSGHSFQRRSHALVPRATLLLFAFPTQGEANCQEEFFVWRVPLFKRGAWTISIQGAYHIVYRSQLASDQTVCVRLSSGAVLAVLGFTLVIRKPQKIIVHILFHNIIRANKLIFIGDKLGGLGQDSMWILPRKTYPGTVILFLSFGFLDPSS